MSGKRASHTICQESLECLSEQFCQSTTVSSVILSMGANGNEAAQRIRHWSEMCLDRLT